MIGQQTGVYKPSDIIPINLKGINETKEDIPDKKDNIVTLPKQKENYELPYLKQEDILKLITKNNIKYIAPEVIPEKNNKKNNKIIDNSIQKRSIQKRSIQKRSIKKNKKHNNIVYDNEDYDDGEKEYDYKKAIQIANMYKKNKSLLNLKINVNDDNDNDLVIIHKSVKKPKSLSKKVSKKVLKKEIEKDSVTNKKVKKDIEKKLESKKILINNPDSITTINNKHNSISNELSDNIKLEKAIKLAKNYNRKKSLLKMKIKKKSISKNEDKITPIDKDYLNAIKIDKMYKNKHKQLFKLQINPDFSDDEFIKPSI